MSYLQYTGHVLQVVLVVLPYPWLWYFDLYRVLSSDAWFDKLIREHDINLGPAFYGIVVAHYCTMSLGIGLVYEEIKFKLQRRPDRLNWRRVYWMNAVSIVYVFNVTASVSFLLAMLNADEATWQVRGIAHPICINHSLMVRSSVSVRRFVGAQLVPVDVAGLYVLVN